MAKLIYISDLATGFSRKRRGRGFEYFNENGKKITDKDILDRIRNLVIPPAWEKVWISPNPCGHLQVTGYDERGRKQYLYHEDWNQVRNEKKFEKLEEFARALPGIRNIVKKELTKKEWSREKVLALVIKILDESYIRIGNRSSRQEFDTYGLTTLRRKHLDINGSVVFFKFRAKGGKLREIRIKGRNLTNLIRECSQLPGYEVFQYYDKKGQKKQVYSNDVNTYLQEISGKDFTAKDFRTWGGTVTALKKFPVTKLEILKNPRKNFSTVLIRNVATELGNTVSVCKTYYVHPVIMDLTDQNIYDLKPYHAKAFKKYPDLRNRLKKEELTALYLVEKGI